MSTTGLSIPTEPMGRVPRPLALIEAMRDVERGATGRAEIEPLHEAALGPSGELLASFVRLNHLALMRLQRACARALGH